MAQSMVNIRMDEDLKKSMEQVCKELGMSMTTAFTIFAKKVSREKRIPFEVSVDPFYSESNMEHLRRSAAELDTGHVVVKTMKELEAAYTNRFTSRIIADYVRCLFQGDDIRQKKRMQASQPRRT